MPYRKQKVIFVIILGLLEISFLTSLNINMHVPVCQHWVWQPEHTHVSVLHIVPCNQCATHCTMQQHNEEAHCPTTQRRHCADGKNGHNTRHTLPVGTARRHRFAEITREEDRWPPEKLPTENRWQKRDRRGPWFEGLNEGDISAKLWQTRALWSMRSTSQSAGANMTNGWTDTPLYVFTCTLFSPSLSFNAELALFVAIFQFVGTEGRPFMFRRMTTDLGDKSRFPPFLKASLERLNCQKYFKWIINSCLEGWRMA